MRKIPLLAFLFCLFPATAVAAPYHLGAPIESYTWGETREEVEKTVGEENVDHRHDDEMFMVINVPTIGKELKMLLIFRDGRLGALLEFDYHEGQIEPAQGDYYKRELARLTAKWGRPTEPQPCLSAPNNCTYQQWHPAPDTAVYLSRTQTPDEMYHTSVSYGDYVLDKQWEEESKRLGVLVSILDPEHTLRTFQGHRIRVKGTVTSTDPVIIYEGHIQAAKIDPREGEAAKFRKGEEITVNGIVTGIEGVYLILKDAFAVPE